MADDTAGSPYGDLDRPPLRPRVLDRALAPDGWRVEVLPRAGSTNELVAARARAGEPAGLVVVAEHQTAGRGRLDRRWTSPPRAGLTLSVLLRPDLPPERLPWLPLWGGLAVARALREQTGRGRGPQVAERRPGAAAARSAGCSPRCP